LIFEKKTCDLKLLVCITMENAKITLTLLILFTYTLSTVYHTRLKIV